MTFSSAKVEEEDSGEGKRAEKMDMEYTGMGRGVDVGGAGHEDRQGHGMEQTWGWT